MPESSAPVGVRRRADDGGEYRAQWLSANTCRRDPGAVRGRERSGYGIQPFTMAGMIR